ncbi:polysaccharide deacetylase family protein [bacterium]|nr:polysaccharide deacetylase family protein [bacterium]
MTIVTIVGFKAKKYPDFIDKMFKSGHEIANHSMNHVCLVRPSPKWSGCPDLSEEKAIKEVNDASLAIQKITGKKPSFLRPPHFAMTPSRKNAIEESLGIKVLIHGSNSVGSLDWSFTDSPNELAGSKTCASL